MLRSRNFAICWFDLFFSLFFRFQVSVLYIVIIYGRRGIVAGPIIDYGPATAPRRGHMICRRRLTLYMVIIWPRRGAVAGSIIDYGTCNGAAARLYDMPS